MGAKFRDVIRGAGGGYQGALEVKLRTEVKKRGAEHWSKVRMEGPTTRTDDEHRVFIASALRTAGRTAGADLIAKTVLQSHVLVRKWRWRGLIDGIEAEQTELEVHVLRTHVRNSSEEELYTGRGINFRTICFEGKPAKAYMLAARLFELRQDWQASDLEATLRSSCQAAKESLGLPAMVGGYPEFVAAVTSAVTAAQT